MTPPRRPAPERSLKRKTATRVPRRTLLVFCEGQVTEPEYLEALRREHSIRSYSSIDLRIEPTRAGSVPLVLVRSAVNARSVSKEDSEIDEFWCVFDVEWPTNHPGLTEALELASKNDINVAVSNPCFELWLALHFQDCGAWLNNDDARRLRRAHDRQPGKRLDSKLYMSRRKEAAQRAVVLSRRHEANGARFPKNNPSSGMHLLLAAVEPSD